MPLLDYAAPRVVMGHLREDGLASITSGHAEILHHVQVTSFGGAPIRLELEEELGYSLVFTYTSDPDLQDVAVRTSVLGDEMRFELVNFDGADGRGSATPVLLGEQDEHIYLMHFRSFLFGRTIDHTLHLTIYRVRKADVDWTPHPA